MHSPPLLAAMDALFAGDGFLLGVAGRDLLGVIDTGPFAVYVLLAMLFPEESALLIPVVPQGGLAGP